MSIADKLTYLDTTKQLLKTEINKINNVLDDNSTFRSYPQELFNGYLDILNNGTDTLWSNLEKVSQIGTEAVLENVENAPMKIELSGNTSQDGTPTPDSPVDIEVVKGENVVSISGENQSDKTDYPIDLTAKNIFDKDNANILNAWINASTKVITASGSNRTIWVEVQPNITYKVKKIADTSSNGRFRVGTSANVPVTGGTLTQVIQNDTAEEISITTSANDKYIAVFCYNTSSSISLDDILDSLEIKEANVVYEEMCKIGDYKDYLFKRNSKWYVHKNIGKATFNGSENWNNTYGESLFEIPNFLNYKIIISGYGLSNYYKYNSVQSGIDANTSNGEFALQVSSSRANIFIKNTSFNNVGDFKTWLSTHNTTVYYVLATPTEEEITNTTLIEQLEAISNAKSVKDKTYVTQTNDGLPFVLDVEAIKKYEVT